MADMSDDGHKASRVRKKSAKVLEMEEFEEAEKKQFTKKTDPSKCGKTPATPSPTSQPPVKKQKIKVEKVEVSPVAKQAPTTPPQTSKASPQAAKNAQTPSSVIKFLLSSPAIPTTPSVSTKAVTKTSPNSELSPGQVSVVSPTVKKTLKSKVKLEPGFMAMEEDEAEPVSVEPVQVTVKQELDIKPKMILSPAQQITTPTPIFSPPTASSRPIDAAGSMDSLKMKLILSPKEKKPKVSFEQMLESGNEATALALAKAVKKKKKKPQDASNKEPVTPKPAPPAEVQSASEAMPNLAALVSSSKKKAPSKKKTKPSPAADLSTPTLESSLATAFNPSKLSDSPIDVEYKYEPNLVIADETDKVKPKKKLTSSGSKTKKKHSQGSSKHEGSGPAPPEGDIAALAAKVKVGDKKGKKKEKEETELLSKKRKRPPTAYTLYCNAHRAKLVSENPGIDFAQISRRLGEMWQTLTKKEKWCWRRKAKKLAGKGSTLISTGKGNKLKAAAAAAAAAATPAAATSSTTSAAPAPAPSLPAAKPMVPHQGARIAKATVEESALSPIKGFGTEPVDVAAHLKLLGESLSIIGMRLQEHKGLIAVQGSMSVLLDSLLCSFGPLMCLTQQVPELNGCSRQNHAKTLDHIAYVMPGL